MTNGHRQCISIGIVFGAALMLPGATISRAQTGTSDPAAAPTSTPNAAQLLQLGEARFDPNTPAELEVKKARTGQLLVRPVVNGHPAGWFIFDTGAGIGCVTTSSVTELGLEQIGTIEAAGGGGTANAPVYRARELVLGPLHCADHPLMAVDLSFLEQHLGEKISGIIGFGLLSRCIAVIDLERGAVSLHDPAQYKLPRGAWTALDLSRRTPIIKAVFEGHEGRFQLDTGDNGHVVFCAPAVRKWKLLEQRDLTDNKLGGVGGFIAAKSGKLAKLEVAGLTIEDVPASFALEAKGTYAQTDRAGRLGAGVLRRFILVVDYGHQRMALLARE